MQPPSSRIGVDVGGTFTDIVSSDGDRVRVLKVPTSKDPSAAVLGGLRRMGPSGRRASLISHATTLATNALLTRSGLAKTAFITNEGFRDVLEIGRQRRPDLYDLNTRRPVPLVERKDRLTLRCRLAADGSEVEPLNGRDSRALASKAVLGEYASMAVCFLNSYVDPRHEVQVRDALRRAGFRGHISLSSEVDPEYREYERASTTVVNAVLAPMMEDYLDSLKDSLLRNGIKSPVYVMNSDGGSSTLRVASSLPVSVIESGPAAGVIAARELANQLGLDRVISFDMGGTTAKAGTVIDGEPDVVTEFEAAGKSHSGRSIKGSGYPVRGEFIDLAEVSAGGGTVAWADEAGELEVGPRSAGSDPGPACYGRGGSEPTVTDANVALGRLNPKALLGGEMKISRPLALQAIRRLSRQLGHDEEDVSLGILRLAIAAMARAVSLVSAERGRDPRDFVLFAFGGAGPVHACDLAEEMEVREIVVPFHAGLFSAYGLLAGDLTRTFSAPIMHADVPLEARFLDLEEAAARAMRSEGFAKFTTQRYVEARYLGQSHEILLAFRGDSSFRSAFDSRHRGLYGYSTSDPVEVVNIRVKESVALSTKIKLRASGAGPQRPPTTREAWFGGKRCNAKVYTRRTLRAGQSGRGPCIIEEYDSTLVVNPSWRWSLENYGTRLRR
jgi:N-methylhydantoinase A